MATVNDLLIRVRLRLNDMQKIKFSDEELIQYLNEAIDNVCGELAMDLNTDIIRSFTLTGTTPILKPINFIKFVGKCPVITYADEDNVLYFKHLDNEFNDILEVFYYATFDKVSKLDDILPFKKFIYQTMLVNSMMGLINPPAPAK